MNLATAEDRRGLRVGLYKFSSAVVISLFIFFGGISAAYGEPKSCKSLFETVFKKEESKFHLPSYLLDKMKEAGELDRSAPLATSLRLLILNTTHTIEKRFLRLGDLKAIHVIDRPSSMAKVLERAEVLRKAQDLKSPLSFELLNHYLPSKNGMRAINSDDGSFYIFDGNGRLFAIKEVFPDDTLIEVEVYLSDSKLLQKNLKKLNEVRAKLVSEKQASRAQ